LHSRFNAYNEQSDRFGSPKLFFEITQIVSLDDAYQNLKCAYSPLLRCDTISTHPFKLQSRFEGIRYGIHKVVDVPHDDPVHEWVRVGSNRLLCPLAFIFVPACCVEDDCRHEEVVESEQAGLAIGLGTVRTSSEPF
jgi:hypothetical protein